MLDHAYTFGLAEQADQTGIPDGVHLPEEIQRCADRLAVMAAAKAKIAERARDRYEKENGHYDTNMARRAEREALGQKTSRHRILPRKRKIR